MNVYFIKCEDDNGFIKIGKSKDVEKRLETLQVGCPYDLSILAVIPCVNDARASETERRLHRYFKKHYVRGEWFRGDIRISGLSDFVLSASG